MNWISPNFCLLLLSLIETTRNRGSEWERDAIVSTYVCVHLQIPFTHNTPTGLLSLLHQQGAHLCSVVFAWLISHSLLCPLSASLSLSQMYGQKTWCQRVGETMGLLPLATWIPTQWWPREYPVSNGINGGIEGEGDGEWEEEREFMSDTSEGLCDLKSTIVCCMRVWLRDDKDGLLLDQCVCMCVCVALSVYGWPNWPSVRVLCSHCKDFNPWNISRWTMHSVWDCKHWSVRWSVRFLKSRGEILAPLTGSQLPKW